MSDQPSLDLGIAGIEDARPVGSGGFAAVYRAFQPAFQRTVAVKVMAAPQLDEKARERFEVECRAMGSLSEHPNIVTLHDAGFTTSGQPYLVMQYMAGGSLADRIARIGAIGWEEAVQSALPVAEALATAHRAGVLHRDVKPANVLLSRYGTVHLADFGIARIADDSAQQGVAATIAYAPPEVLVGGAPSPSADLYALGVTMHETITGTLPFPPRQGENTIAWVARIANEPVPDLRRFLVPDEVCDLLAALMDKDASLRPASAAAVVTTLQGIARRHGLGPAGAEHDRTPAPQPQPQPSPDPPVAPVAGPVATGDIHLGPARPARPSFDTPNPVAGGGWRPTHRVPLTGLSAWNRPDPELLPIATLDPWLEVEVAEWVGVWARVVCANRWEAWVDGRYLEIARG